jgi:Carboxypeptidase regulatory-like domain/Bacterial Ig-like domain (group 1)/Prenyltransferase and squalene oxidase repeat
LLSNSVARYQLSRVSHAIRGLIPLVLVCFGCTISAQTLPPEVALGTTWLIAQVQSDGSVAGEGASIARPAQVRAETALTLKQLTGALPGAVATRLQLDADVSTEILSRKILVSLVAGGDPGAMLASLALLQNADGGFGANSGYQSNALDTAWALRALAAAGRGAGSGASAARGFLVRKIGSDGAVTGTSTRQTTLDTAHVLNALRAQTSDVANIELAGSYLKSTRGTNGAWLANDFVTAEVWLALSAAIASTADRGLTQSYLKSLQRADGSWGGDPFVTALALRALAAEAAPPTPTQGTVTGRIVDSNGAGLSGVTITLSAPAGNVSSTSNGNGDFAVAGLAVGQYQLTAAKPGYQSVQVSFSLAAGQQLVLAPITLGTIATSGIIRGVVTKAADGTVLSGVTVTLAGSPARVTTTNDVGAYEFSSVPPGSVALSAGKTGFDTVTATATIAAGQILVFSPALSATGTTPSTPSRINGKVISTVNAAALQGVSVLVDGVEIIKTPASGLFDVELAAGAHRVSFVLAGYTTLAQDFVLQRNAVLSFGNVALSPVRATSRITGKVTQSGGGALQGVLIQIEGGASVQSAADGSYALDNVTATSIKLTASLPTYQSQSVTIALPLPRDVAQDFTLQSAATAALSFNAATVSPGTVAANSRVVMSAPLSNGGTAGAATVIVLQVRDSADKVIDRGIPIDANGQPIAGIELAAGETRGIRAEWNSGRFPPGTYSLVLRAVTPGSLNRSLPDGQLVAETRASVQITAESRIAGTVTANPPVLRVGSSAPIQLVAAVKNAGNTPLTPQAYRLTATKSGATSAAYSQQVSAPVVALGGVFSLSFPDWTPTEGGNYDLVLTAESASGSLATTVYVGDTASAVYTVTPNKTPIGTQTIQGKIAVTGQDAVSGRISDPLAPLIKSAITSAVGFNDTETAAWTLRNNCQGCHIQTQGLVGGEVNRRLTTGDAFKRAVILNNTSTNQTEYGTYNEGFSRSAPQTMTALGLWAMTNYHDRDSQAASLRRASNYVVSTQTASGRWEYDHAVGWLAANYASTAFNLQSLAETYRTIKRAGANAATFFASQPFGALVAGASRGFVSQGSDGSLYLSTRSGEVIKRRVDGTTLFTWTGLNEPRRTLPLPDGRVVVVTGSGIVELKSDGSTPLLAAVSDAYDLVIGKNGKIYADAWSANTLYEIDPVTWVISDWLASKPGHGLQNPARLYVESDGSLLVTNYGAREIVRFKPDKSFERVTVQTNGNPAAITRYQNKWWVSTTTGLYRYNDSWEGERVAFASDFASWGGGFHEDVLVLQSGELVTFPYNANSLMRIAPETVSTTRFADAGQPYQTGYHFSEDTDGTIYFSDRYYGTIRAFSPSGVFTGKTWSPGGNPYKPLRLQSGELIVGTTSGLYRLNADGTSTQLIATSEVFDLVQTLDGRILTISYYNNRILRIDPATWTLSDWLDGNYPVPLSNPWHVVSEADGSILISNHGANQIVRVKPDKSMQVVASGFNGNPTDMAFFKGKWWVSTTTGVYRYNANWALEDRVATGLYVDLQSTSSNRLLAVKDQSTEIFEFVDSAAAVPSDMNQIATAIDRATTYLMGVDSRGATDGFDLAHQLIGLEAARKFYAPTDASRADAIYAKMEPIGTALRLRQNPDGGYGRYWYGAGHSSNYASDSLMTAQIGVALDALNPSARSPEVRKAIEWALANQDANGSWYSQNGIFSTREAATTWVAIWLPTMLDRLGGIDTDVTVVNAPESLMSNPRPAPATVETLSTGETRYVWSMQGVTAAGREITFDLTMPDLKPGEKRTASTEAYLTFKNSFTVEDQRAPIDVPVVTASAQVDLGITTDKPVYGANTPVLAPIVLTNNNPAAISGTLTAVIRDTAGVEVARLTQQAATIPTKSQLTVPTTWNTGTTVVGRYSADAELRDPATGRLLASGTTQFDVIAIGPLLSGTVATDKALYQSREQVIITGRAYNQAANLYLNNHRVEEKVFAPDNTLVYSGSRAVQQIAPGSFSELKFPFRLNNAPPVTYRVEQKIFDETGVLKDTQMTSFKVGSSVDTGFGLTGTIAASPKQVRIGERLTFASAATNTGNSAFANLPLKVVLVDPEQGSVLAQYPTTAASIAIGGRFDLPVSTWTASGRSNATYLAVLIATIGSGATATDLTLATDSFQVLPQVAATIAATAGTPQAVTITQPYPSQLEATVLDTAGSPFPNALVTFTAPAQTGASVTFAAGNTATTDAFGKARVSVVANGNAGGFTVTASTPGATPSPTANSADFVLTNQPAQVAKIAVFSGTPQTALVTKAYAQPLKAIVTNNLNQPVVGALVSFAAPSGAGASVTFPAGTTTTTDAQGIATVAVTANGNAGRFQANATTAGVAGAALFDLTNRPPNAAVLEYVSGSPQSITVTQRYAQALVARVKDELGAPMSGILVTFAAPASTGSNATAAFPAGASVVTNAQGLASVSAVANNNAGSFTVTATAADVSGSVPYALTNTAPVAANIVVTSGTPQAAKLNATYAQPLVATVRDNLGNTMAGVVVTFAAPNSATVASATFPGGNTAVTGANGQASVTAKANGVSGSFTVSATAPNVSGSADYALIISAPAAALLEYVSGSPQTAKTGTAFTLPLVARVKDDSGNPMAGITVSFAAPSGGASATFTAGNTAVTNASGLASLTVMANTTAGSYSITATAAGVPGSASFALTNTQGCGRADAVSFVPLTNVAPQTLVRSNTVQVSGLGNGCTASARITAGAYRIIRTGTVITTKALATLPSPDFSTQPQTVQDGDQITLEQMSSDKASTRTTATLTLDGNNYDWNVTTASGDATPVPIPLLPDQEPARSLVLLLMALMLVTSGGWGLWRKRGFKP